jgi:hypothetical protein
VSWSWIGWLRAQIAASFADGFRLLFGLFYWNARKSIYLARGRRGRNPCQNEADGDRPGTIRCDACISWTKQGRFRHVCPLLISNQGEWACSAPRGEVRAFWGRAALISGAAALAAYLLAASAVFAVLRATHAGDVAWQDVAWPGRWEEIPKARARSFALRAAEAFIQNRNAEALLSLGSARRLDAREYRTRLLDAQLAMYQFNVKAADAEFASMLEEYPAEAFSTAIGYHDVLIALFRAEPLAEHSLRMAARDREHVALWVRSLLHALRMAPFATAFAASHEREIAALPAHARLLVEAEVAAQRGDAAGARAGLALPFDGPRNVIYMQEQVARLARLGDRDAASLLLYRYAGNLGEFETLLSRLDLDFLAHDDAAARLDFHRLLQLIDSPVKVERTIALLVTHPGQQYYRDLHDALRGKPAFAQRVSGAAMWVAGLVCEVYDEAQAWKTTGYQQPGDGYPAISGINFDSRQLDVANSVPHLINTLTLPRDVIFALQRRMPPPTVAPVSARAAARP